MYFFQINSLCVQIPQCTGLSEALSVQPVQGGSVAPLFCPAVLYNVCMKTKWWVVTSAEVVTALNQQLCEKSEPAGSDGGVRSLATCYCMCATHHRG